MYYLTMAHYCDSKELERNWFLWLIAKDTPDLEPYREAGILWTSVPRTIVSPQGEKFRDPRASSKKHIIALDYFYTFACENGVVEQRAMQCLEDNLVFSKGIVPLPPPSRLQIDSRTQGLLIRDDFFKEEPARITYEKMSTDILNICLGVAIKFRPPTDDDKHELAHGALVQALQKIKNNKLVFTPGRAPVFSLVTTTVYRCMCSIMNKTNKETRRRSALAEDLVIGAVKPNTRTLRTSKPS